MAVPRRDRKINTHPETGRLLISPGTVDLSSVHGLDSDENAVVGGDLDQQSRPHSARLRAASSAVLAPLHWMPSLRL